MIYRIDLTRLAEIARRVEQADPAWHRTAPAREIKPECRHRTQKSIAFARSARVTVTGAERRIA